MVPSDVLVVANPYEAERLRRALVAAGHRAVCADGGASTLAQIGRVSPRLVLLAHPLARGDAGALIAGVRAEAAALPIVLIGDDGPVSAAVQARLSRPLDLSALLRIVEELTIPATVAPGVGPAPSAPPSPEQKIEEVAEEELEEEIDLEFDLEPDSQEPAPPVAPPAAPPLPPVTATPVPAPATSAPAVVERGRLCDSDVATLLGRLYREGFTGRLTLREGDAEKSVALEGGFPISASSNLPGDRMAEHLFRAGRLTRAQYEESKSVVAETGRKTGAILVERGFLRESELLGEVRRHYEDIVYSTFGWEAGEYGIVAGEAAAERVRLSTHPAALVVEGIRRRGDPGKLAARLGGMRATLRPTGRQDLLRDAALQEQEWRAAMLMDGNRPLGDVARRAGLSEDEVVRLAWAMLVLAMVKHPTAVMEAQKPGWEMAPEETQIDLDRVVARHALVREGDYFEVLGVPRDATKVEVQRAHQRARGHFDAAKLPRDVVTRMGKELEEISLVLDEALRILSDDARREAYKKAIE